MNTKQYTLKAYPGTAEAKKELSYRFPGFRFWSGVFDPPEDYRGSTKVRIFARYWRGECAGSVRSSYGVMYKAND